MFFFFFFCILSLGAEETGCHSHWVLQQVRSKMGFHSTLNYKYSTRVHCSFSFGMIISYNASVPLETLIHLVNFCPFDLVVKHLSRSKNRKLHSAARASYLHVTSLTSSPPPLTSSLD